MDTAEADSELFLGYGVGQACGKDSECGKNLTCDAVKIFVLLEQKHLLDQHARQKINALTDKDVLKQPLAN